MGISSHKRLLWQSLSIEDQDRIVRMAWEDRASFDNIQGQFGLTPNDVVRFMRRYSAKKVFRRWRKRVSQRGHLKHLELRPKKVDRFKCSRQSVDGIIKGKK